MVDYNYTSPWMKRSPYNWQVRRKVISPLPKSPNENEYSLEVLLHTLDSLIVSLSSIQEKLQSAEGEQLSESIQKLNQARENLRKVIYSKHGV